MAIITTILVRLDTLTLLFTGQQRYLIQAILLFNEDNNSIHNDEQEG